MRRRRSAEERAVIPLAPLIDCVFLLLAYFVVSSSLEKPEGRLGFPLPGPAEPGAAVEVIEEVVIEIGPDGIASLNDERPDPAGTVRLRGLEARLARFRATAVAGGGDEPVVVVSPSGATPQRAVVAVLEAVANAGIRAVRIAGAEEGP